MRPAHFASMIFLGLFMAGCGTPGDTGKPPTTPISARPSNGVVRGQVLRPPGPDPRSGSAPTSQVPVNGDPVSARHGNGPVVASTVSDQGGRFELTLPPGTYRIGEDTCGTYQDVDIREGGITPLTLVIPNDC
jgi:hypothetical protein